MLALVAGTLIGIVATLVAGTEPGFLLGFFIIVGAIVGTLGIRPDAVYLFFPLPAFAFFLGALITGKIHDSTLSSSAAGLAAGFTQWIAGIFFPMCVGTILVLLIGGARWLLSRQLVGGQFSMSADRPMTPRGPRPAAGPRPDVDPWADPQATRSRPAVRPGNPGNDAAARPDPDGGRPSRPARSSRDPWNDPRPAADTRPAADRRPPSRNVPPSRTVPPGRSVPPAAPQPGFTPRPAKPDQRAPAPPRPARPPRDQWD